MKTFAALTLAVCLIPQTSIFGSPPPDLAGLIEKLKSDKPAVRARAADDLGELGPLAAPAVEALTAAIDDPNLTVQIESLIALERIGPERVAAGDQRDPAALSDGGEVPRPLPDVSVRVQEFPERIDRCRIA